MPTKNKKNPNHLSKIEKELRKNDFRVAIFGSARTEMGDKDWRQVYNLAKMIGKKNWDVVTGGGPGLMDAANAGHAAGDPKMKSDNIGLVIKLPWENSANKFVEIKRTFSKFSDRLDTFIALSSAAIITPGGVGTCLEFFYVWQLVQVKHIQPIPIILIDGMWTKLIEWIKKYPLKEGLISPKELDCIHVVKNNSQAMKILEKTYRTFSHNGHKTNKNYLA